MQYSTNSDEAIRFTIRSSPTFAGQYRQAVLQMRDRLQALQAYKFSTAKIEQSIKIEQLQLKKAKYFLDSKPCEVGSNPYEVLVCQAEMDLRSIEIEEKRQQLNQGLDLVEDAHREVSICQQEINRIAEESGCDFAVLPLAEFQKYMVEDFRQIKARAIASSWIAGGVGAIEALLELPGCDIEDYLRRVSILIKEFAAIQGANEKTTGRIANGAS